MGIDDKLRSKNRTTVRYFLTDHLGSTEALTDTSGKIVSSTSYDSFGNATSNIATTYRYTGREYDADTGLYYYRNRWYDPEIGRFISTDPIGFAGGDINLYGYVGNNPLSFTDPSGNSPCGPGRGNQDEVRFRRTNKKASFSSKRFTECLKEFEITPTNIDTKVYFAGQQEPDGGVFVFTTIHSAGNQLVGYRGFFKGTREDGGKVGLSIDGVSRTIGDLDAAGLTPGTYAGTVYVGSDIRTYGNHMYALSTAVHEIGNGLGKVMRRRATALRPPPNPKVQNPLLRKHDNDPGQRLEECVFGGAVGPKGYILEPYTKPLRKKRR